MKQILDELEREWTAEDGALFKYRSAEFDSEAFDRLKEIIKKIDFGNERLIDRDVVSFTWNIPLFLHAHSEINIERNPDKENEIRRHIENIYKEVDRIFYFRDNFGEV